MTTPDWLTHLLDITQIAEHLRVQVRHVRRLVAGRRIPFVKWGHLLRFDPSEIEAWIAGHHVDVSDRRRPHDSVRGRR